MDLLKAIRDKFKCRIKCKKTRPVVTGTRRQRIEVRYLMEIKNLEAAIKYETPKTAKVRYFSLIKDFFCELFDVNEAMTFEEIMKKMHRAHINPETKEKLYGFLEGLPALEYGTEKMTKRKMKKGLKEFRKLIQEI